MDQVLMAPSLWSGLGTLLAVIAAVAGTILIFRMNAKTRAKTLAEDIQRQLDGAKKEAENIIKAAQIDAAAEAIRRKEEFAGEVNQIRTELRETEMRLTKREDVLERQTEALRRQETLVKDLEKEVERRQHNIDQKEQQLNGLIAQQKNQLLKMTGLDVEEAKKLLLQRLEDECEHEMASLIRRKLDEAQETAEEKGREIITTAIQRYARTRPVTPRYPRWTSPTTT